MNIEFNSMDELPSKYRKDTIFLVKCPEWNEEGYQVCTFNGKEFKYSDQPNDMFMECIEGWALIFWDSY